MRDKNEMIKEKNMQLILTDDEKKAATWLELDDESIGKIVKAGAFEIKNVSEEEDRLTLYSAALILISATAKTNADKLKQTINRLTIQGKPYGDWILTITKAKDNK
jgi:hypothetical protein